jgi:hypothetical protein
VRYCEQKDGVATKGEQRVPLVGAIVLHAVRRAARRDIGLATCGVASKYGHEQSTFTQLIT